MKTFLGIACATAFFTAAAGAEPSTTTTQETTTTAAAGTEATGTITEITPGSTIVLNTGASEPVHYKFGKTVTIVSAKGRTVDATRLKKDKKVRLHYSKEGSDMVVDKVTIVKH
jgi:hypothetical protein